jgi:hypothetical protein
MPLRFALMLLACAATTTAADPSAQSQLIRQQQSDAFALQLQQSVDAFRAGPLAPSQRLELESQQRDQRLRQADTFYRQRVQQSQTPAGPGVREAELMRFNQENNADLSRAADDAAILLERSRPMPKAAPNPEPAVIWAPVLR